MLVGVVSLVVIVGIRFSKLKVPGALVLVSHDRHLVDRVTTEILALDGSGGVVLLGADRGSIGRDSASGAEHNSA